MKIFYANKEDLTEVIVNFVGLFPYILSQIIFSTIFSGLIYYKKIKKLKIIFYSLLREFLRILKIMFYIILFINMKHNFIYLSRDFIVIRNLTKLKNFYYFCYYFYQYIKDFIINNMISKLLKILLLFKMDLIIIKFSISLPISYAFITFF